MPGGGGPVAANWIPWVEWLDPNQAFQLTDDVGLSVVHNPAGIPVCAGKATRLARPPGGAPLYCANGEGSDEFGSRVYVSVLAPSSLTGGT